MGFDLYGNNKKSPTGKYFRNNCWWWRPLADYVLENCEIPEEEKKHWGSNDGQKVSEKTALKIAKTLKTLMKTGAVKKFEEEHTKRLEELPEENCKLCEGTGKRKDMEVENGCNACQGNGKVKPFASHYPFSEENVKEFADFCEKSGGFEIY